MIKVFDHYAGEIRNLPDEDARELVDTGRAEYVNDDGKIVKRPPRKKT